MISPTIRSYYDVLMRGYTPERGKGGFNVAPGGYSRLHWLAEVFDPWVSEMAQLAAFDGLLIHTFEGHSAESYDTCISPAAMMLRPDGGEYPRHFWHDTERLLVADWGPTLLTARKRVQAVLSVPGA